MIEDGIVKISEKLVHTRWQNCGYMETWGGVADPTGQEQGGFFDLYGEPLMEALVHVKAANEQAVQWHQRAGYPKQEQVQAGQPLTGVAKDP
jgi:hypothetical protein